MTGTTGTSGTSAGTPAGTPAGASPVRRAFIGLGSNLGDRMAALRLGVALLKEGGDVTAVSPLYETEPVGGPTDQGAFLNVVVELATTDSPRQLLIRCQGGPSYSRLETFPPPLEVEERGGLYVLDDDGPVHRWRYEFVPRTF